VENVRLVKFLSKIDYAVLSLVLTHDSLYIPPHSSRHFVLAYPLFMKLWVGITDNKWFALHASKSDVEEVNFWKPSSKVGFRALQWGEPFLFKLKGARYIAGGGFFTKFLQLPLSLAWDAFGEANGARSLAELRELIARNRSTELGPLDDPIIGCSLLVEPFFFEDEPIPVPQDWGRGIQIGRTYDTSTDAGANLWREVQLRLQGAKAKSLGPATQAAIEGGYGSPVLIMPRLGQGSFRLLLTDAYRYRCAMSGERTLPVLEAAHIRPYSQAQDHSLSNGLLLRSDLHKLFDLGYVGVNPKTLKIEVSRRIREEFGNGRDYDRFNDQALTMPQYLFAVPSKKNLEARYESFRR
jgi:putative restriction endonuclease